MPLLQENTPKRDLRTVLDSVTSSDHETSLSNVTYPTFPNSAMFTPSQILMASQLMAASRLSLPANSAFFHPGLLPLAWQANSPPSPPPAPTSPALSSRKLNNNNVVVSSSTNGLGETLRKTRKWKHTKTDAPLASPTSSVSPPDSVKEPINNRDRPFTCEVCNRSFGYKHVLQNHERTHTGEKPFECKQCHKRFTRDHHLKTHIRLHTGERPYHCHHCDRQFVQVANLRRHLRVHTGERPYTCERCSAKFSDSNQLKAHILTHTNEKPFECDRCHGTFRRRHHLLNHKCGSIRIDEELAEDDPMAPKRPLHAPTVPLVTLPLHVALPEQTEPEDLSMSTGLHSHSSGDSPMSRSPSSREDLDDLDDMDARESADIFLRGKHLQ